MELRKLLVVGCLSLISLVSHAESLRGLYQVSEPVSGQAPQERDQATQRALETLVLRLTGDAKAVENPALAAIRKDPQQIITQYGYDAGPPESLQIKFDQASTDRALRQAGLTLLGRDRPSLLGWWLNDSAEGSSLVGDAQAAAAPLRRAAQHRGLALRLPLGDLNEQIVATAPTLEGNDPAPLRAVSQRYGADGLLAVHAREEAGQWQARWHLWLGGRGEQGTVQGADREALADAVMLAVSQRLAPRFAAKPGVSREQQVLEVQGMTLARYAVLGHLLEPFAARLIRVDGDRAVYRVRGSVEQLRAQLGGANLRELPVAQAQVSGAQTGTAAPVTAQLRFRW